MDNQFCPVIFENGYVRALCDMTGICNRNLPDTMRGWHFTDDQSFKDGLDIYIHPVVE